MHPKVKFYSEKQVDGVIGWYWIDTDNGAWTGPKDDWEQSHKNNILRHVSKFDTVIQAGGNLGMYPRLLSSMFRTVYTFEPDPLNFFVLTCNTPVDNVIRMQAAVGENSGKFVNVRRLTMSNVGMHQVGESETGLIPQVTIDSLNIQNVDLIMLDIEGYELHAIAGATSTISKHLPVIFAERPTPDVLNALNSLGYKQVTQSKMDGVFVHKSK